MAAANEEAIEPNMFQSV